MIKYGTVESTSRMTDVSAILNNVGATDVVFDVGHSNCKCEGGQWLNCQPASFQCVKGDIGGVWGVINGRLGFSEIFVICFLEYLDFIHQKCDICQVRW